jgi:uncharacterized tellurite resistance protein B-like protein
MIETESVDQQSSPAEKEARDALAVNTEVLQRFFGEDAHSYVASLREQQGNAGAIHSLTMGILLSLNDEQKDEFIKILSEVVASRIK